MNCCGIPPSTCRNERNYDDAEEDHCAVAALINAMSRAAGCSTSRVHIPRSLQIMGTRNRTRQTDAKILGQAYGQIMNELEGPITCSPWPELHASRCHQADRPAQACSVQNYMQQEVKSELSKSAGSRTSPFVVSKAFSWRFALNLEHHGTSTTGCRPVL